LEVKVVVAGVVGEAAAVAVEGVVTVTATA
jgi:hypothetical protein